MQRVIWRAAICSALLAFGSFVFGGCAGSSEKSKESVDDAGNVVGAGDAAENVDGAGPGNVDVSSLDSSSAGDGSSDTTVADAAGDTETVATMVIKQVVQESLPEPANFVLRGLWGHSGGPIFAVGQDGVVLRRTSSEWSVESYGLFPYLHGVAGQNPTDALAVGVGGARAYYDGAGWDGGDSCTADSDCDDQDPCTDDICNANLCKYVPQSLPGCCGSLAMTENFDAATTMSTLVVKDMSPDKAGVLWNVASNANRATSPPSALYFGNPGGICPGTAGTCPGFSNGSKIVGASVTLPPVDLPNAETITARFDLFLDVETGAYDMLTLEVESGSQSIPVWSKADLEGASGKTYGFVPIDVDLTAFANKQIRLRFVFDSVDGGVNTTEGVYIDTLAISTQCGTQEDFSFTAMPTLFDIAAASDGTYYAVGLNGSVWRYEPSSGWSDMMAAARGDWFGAHIKNGVLLVGGSDGRLVQKQGGEVLAPESGTKLRIAGVRVFDDGTRIAVGDAGLVLKAEPEGDFQAMAGVPTAVNLSSVDGPSPDDLTIVGAGGTAISYDGTSFTLQPTPTTVDLTSVAVLPNGHRFAVGMVGTILENSGGGWVAKAKVNNDALYGITATGVDTVIAVGNYGTILRRNATTGEYIKDSGVTSKNLKDVYAIGPERAWAVGLLGTILTFNGQSWEDMSLADDPMDLYGVAGESKEEFYVVGAGGAVIAVKADGTMESLLGATENTLRGVFALDKDHVWAVGSLGTILVGSRNVWAPQWIKEPGPDGEEVPVPTTLYGVWAAAPDDVWVVGDGGITAHFDGKKWKKNEDQTDPRTLRGITGSASNDVFAVGTAGAVVHWDGETWTTVNSGTVSALHDLLIDEYGQVLVVGDSGTVLMIERE